MRYRFNETNIATGLIKELLKEFNLPMYTVYTEGKPIYPGKLYIKNSTIYVGEGSGDSAELVPVNDYIYNQKQINMTKNLVINSSVYDSYTHTYLGNYLRFMRDYNRLNLMPLYNCFNTETLSGVNQFISLSSGNTFEINTYNTSNTYYLIPIKFNEQYTIAIDSPVTYELACMIHTPSGLTDLSKELMADTYKKIPGSQFSSPYIFSTDFDATKYWSFENNLRLLIKLPAIASNSTITVLEGNYTASARCQNSIVSSFAIDDKNGFGIYPTRLSLLDMNDGVSYPFADRLLEYLSNNAIVPQEKITDNIGRLQRAVYNNSRFKGAYDIWDPQLRISLFNRLSDKINKKNFYNIYREDAGNTPASKMSLLLGNTTQAGSSGKNKLGLANGTYSNNGITAVVNNGLVTVSGSTDSSNVSVIYIPISTIPSSLGTLTKSLNPTGTYTGLQTSVRNSSGAGVGLWTDNAANNTGTLSANGEKFRIEVNVSKTINCTIKPQIEVGSTATAYEPCLSPLTPQQIHSVSGDNEIRVVGKNLASSNAQAQTINGITFTPNEDGSITAKGTATGGFSYSIYGTTSAEKGIPLVGGQTYTFSGAHFQLNGTTAIAAMDTPKTRQAVDGDYISYIWLYYGSGVTVDKTYYPQLEVGSTVTTYEPYKAQVYPINLPVENLCPPLTVGIGINSTNGVETQSNISATSDYIAVDFNKNPSYYLSGLDDGLHSFVYSYDANKQPLHRTGGMNREEIKLTSAEFTGGTATGTGDIAYVRVTQYWLSGDNGDISAVPSLPIQLEKGSKANFYNPYGSPSIELNALGNYKDYFHKTDGKWYLHKEFNKVDLGSLTWTRRTTNIFSSALPTPANVSGTVSSLCNQFPVEYAAGYAGTSSNTVALYKTSSTTTTTTIYLNLRTVDTVADLTTWFASNQTELTYPIASTETEITDTTLISQLEELSKATGYDGETNIIQSNNDLSFDISNLEKILDLNKDIAEESKPIVDINENIKFIDTTPDLLSYGDKDVETFLGVAR